MGAINGSSRSSATCPQQRQQNQKTVKNQQNEENQRLSLKVIKEESLMAGETERGAFISLVFRPAEPRQNSWKPLFFFLQSFCDFMGDFYDRRL